MKLATPRWWYVRESAPAPITRALLTPVSWIWAAVTANKIAKTVSVDPGVPVVCIGNLTVGGVGKTPIVREIVRLLRAAGIEAHGLSRGYGGRLAGPVRVDPADHTAADVGDEPLMLAGDMPFWVSRDRPAGALAAAAAGAQAVVMDDGHQNLSVKKTLSLVVVDGETRNNEWPFGDGAVFPAGPMREPLKAGLARADAVIVLLPADLPSADPELLALFSGKPVFIARLEPAAPPPSGPQVGFAGIGKPWKVERSLAAAGCDLKDFAPFPDHGAYDEATLEALARRAEDFDAGLVTTEKDWVRLPPQWRERIKAWPVRARFEDEAAVEVLLTSTLSAHPREGGEPS
ncbi:tetraacyldisaccharide 4'-kinase [Caulobacter segnis]|uniref:tetraacyldisaccharide 4'-kinase n=1 Tax=Caulobacter segnis TaxID=88688 RepID=UPI002410666B|nr:tetraacyldisaccharide 4'-kinase [Caulobacter segnis]MDG2519983.1 tetraacyldisaccharide 4'-kinase [Caulobacter segnis]